VAPRAAPGIGEVLRAFLMAASAGLGLRGAHFPVRTMTVVTARVLLQGVQAARAHALMTSATRGRRLRAGSVWAMARGAAFREVVVGGSPSSGVARGTPARRERAGMRLVAALARAVTRRGARQHGGVTARALRRLRAPVRLVATLTGAVTRARAGALRLVAAGAGTRLAGGSVRQVRVARAARAVSHTELTALADLRRVAALAWRELLRAELELMRRVAVLACHAGGVKAAIPVSASVALCTWPPRARRVRGPARRRRWVSDMTRRTGLDARRAGVIVGELSMTRGAGQARVRPRVVRRVTARAFAVSRHSSRPERRRLIVVARATVRRLLTPERVRRVAAGAALVTTGRQGLFADHRRRVGVTVDAGAAAGGGGLVQTPMAHLAARLHGSRLGRHGDGGSRRGALGAAVPELDAAVAGSTVTGNGRAVAVWRMTRRAGRAAVCDHHRPTRRIAGVAVVAAHAVPGRIHAAGVERKQGVCRVRRPCRMSWGPSGRANRCEGMTVRAVRLRASAELGLSPRTRVFDAALLRMARRARRGAGIVEAAARDRVALLARGVRLADMDDVSRRQARQLPAGRHVQRRALRCGTTLARVAPAGGDRRRRAGKRERPRRWRPLP
jgi:hypothetical protein